MTDVRTDERRKPGRPRKFGQGRINATVRFTPKTYDALKTAADSNGRSVSEEVEKRIERIDELEFQLNEWLRSKEDIEKLRAASKVQFEADRIQAIRLAGAQIVRDAGGNVTVNVSPELLLAEADGILRSGFVALKNIDKSPTEIMIERVVRREIETALSKTRLTIGKDDAV
jgi:hypothetical protein